MDGTYFTRLASQTPSRVWVNNPTPKEIDLALGQGAVGCTTNPAYGGGLLKRDPGYAEAIIGDACKELPTRSVLEIATHVQAKLVAHVAAQFSQIFEASRGGAGLVSLQGAPEEDTDGEHIWEEAEGAKALCPNVAPKIPATLPGLVAFERVVESAWPVIVTEVFSLDQVKLFCERYQDISAKTGTRSAFLMSPITGILGDHLKNIARAEELDILEHEMELAGVYLARRCAALVRERDYPVTLLFGGARTTEDLTGLVGAAHHATINWSTFADINALSPPLERTIDRPPDRSVAQRLLSTFPDVWKGWELGRLAPEEFETFGPVQHFRSSFIAAWHSVESAVEEQLQHARVGARKRPRRET